jgi:hypothetical protein
VHTPFVCVVQHDRVFERPIDVEEICRTMVAREEARRAGSRQGAAVPRA